MFLTKTPAFIHVLYPKAIWRMRQKFIYLTFDDGPTPEITTSILSVLDSYGIKATFFCLGCNVVKYPELFAQIKQEGHTVGNHGFSHLNGWKTNSADYVADIEKGFVLTESKLFRPPYGKIKRSQLAQLSQFQTVFWDVMPGDFSPLVDVQMLVENVVNNVESGSIVVLHDSQKCGKKVIEALPRIVEQLLAKGFKFSALPSVDEVA